MAEKNEKMVPKILNKSLCKVQIFPKAVSPRNTEESVSDILIHTRLPFGYPYPFAN